MTITVLSASAIDRCLTDFGEEQRGDGGTIRKQPRRCGVQRCLPRADLDTGCQPRIGHEGDCIAARAVRTLEILLFIVAPIGGMFDDPSCER